MTDITHDQIRDLLPDLLHAKVDEARRRQIEEHLHSCAECASEMRVLQMVKSAPSFAPLIDAVKVSSAILPYGGIPAERARPKSRVWQVALAAAAVVVLAITMISRRDAPGAPSVAPARIASSAPVVVAAPSSTQPPAKVTPSPVQSRKPGRELQVAVGLDGLSDGSVAQLARELDALDGIPSGEPEHLGVTDPGAGTEGGR